MGWWVGWWVGGWVGGVAVVHQVGGWVGWAGGWVYGPGMLPLLLIIWGECPQTGRLKNPGPSEWTHFVELFAGDQQLSAGMRLSPGTVPG
jgi:hypothetical protein